MAKGIYKIINVVNNKFYVGSAVDLKRRRIRHFSELRTGKHNNKHLQAAWNKYGESAFIFVVLEKVDDSVNILELEDVWLKNHVGKDYCYNMGKTATAPMLGMAGELSPTWGYIHTVEAKLKIGASSKGRTQSEEEKVKRRQTMAGHNVSAETRAKISASLMGDKNFNYGKPRSDEFKEKVSKRVHMIRENTTTEYASIVELREATGLKSATVNRALKSGKLISRGPFTGCVIQYLK
jgi:group I intron endonuclease